VSGASGPFSTWRFDAIGTGWQIDTSEPLDESARGRIDAVIDRFDREWSRFRADSVVSGLARRGGSAPAPPDAARMLDAYAVLDAATGGAVNPLVGASLAARGYDTAYAFVDRGARPAPRDWRDRLRWEQGTLELVGPELIDVGALGKGRLVDKVAAEVAASVAGPFVVDASGDLIVAGTAERVALEHPYDSRRAIGVVEVADAALCASATNRRAWGDGLHHVLDARTGEPVRTIAATWAIAPCGIPDPAMRADAIATALFFEGGPESAAVWGIDWVRMTTDGRVEWSPGSRAELFT